MKPLMIINFKVYEKSIENSIEIAEIIKKVSEETGANIVVAPSHLSLKEISNIVPTFAQSIDPLEFGQHTGAIIAEEVKKCGAIGALINHSEKRIPYEDVEICVNRCKENGLISVVCVENLEEAKRFAKFCPDFIAIEPPELIGKVSVTEADPKIVKDVVDSVDVDVICGAGIKTKEDVKKAIDLGAVGVLISSGIINADDIEKTMSEMAEGLISFQDF